MTHRAALYDLLAVLAVSLVMVACVIYAEERYLYDVRTLLLCIVAPLVFGVAILSLRRDRTLLFGFLALFWAVIDDRPIFFDSILTWPEVTRFHPFLPRLFMNIVIHTLTIVFLYLTIRESMKGSGVRLSKAPRVIILASVAFVFAYAREHPSGRYPERGAGRQQPGVLVSVRPRGEAGGRLLPLPCCLAGEEAEGRQEN